MKDFCTGREIDIQALINMARYGEEAKEFNMSEFLNSCRTAGCLLGTYVIRENIPCKSIFDFLKLGMHGFQLSRREWEFLFNTHVQSKTIPRLTTDCIPNGIAKAAIELNKEQATKRLRKFIYWKMRKSELLDNLEPARHREGNWNFNKEVEREVAMV